MLGVQSYRISVSVPLDVLGFSQRHHAHVGIDGARIRPRIRMRLVVAVS